MDSFQACKEFMEQELLPWLKELPSRGEGKTAVQHDRHTACGYRQATEWYLATRMCLSYPVEFGC
jgi:hypothetical protein